MIHVYRVPAASFLTAREAAPTFTATTIHDVVRSLEARGATETECDAARHALHGSGATPRADLVLLEGGSLYRVYAEGPLPPAPVAGPFTAEPDARVLVATLDPGCAALRDALRFLGYRATARHPNPSEPDAVEAAAAAADAHVALVSPATLELMGEERVRAMRGARAVVAIGAAPDPPGELADALVPSPLRVEQLASVIDPLVRRVAAMRGANASKLNVNQNTGICN